MTAHLQGRALDEACAKAMGWHVGNWVDGGELTMLREPPSQHGQTIYAMCAYSTDPATLDEKLAWLRSRGTARELCIGDDSTEGYVECYAFIIVWDSEGDFGINERTTGDTIHEATARLVVAVAEAQKDKK